MKQNLIDIPYCITRHTGYQGAHRPVSNQAGNDKQATGRNRNRKLDLFRVRIWYLESEKNERNWQAQYILQ